MIHVKINYVETNLIVATFLQDILQRTSPLSSSLSSSPSSSSSSYQQHPRKEVKSKVTT